MTSLPQLSVTFDEPVHILTGYSIWRTGDLRLLEDHPPLLELWMSWPLLLDSRLPSPTEVSTWNTGDRRLFAHHDVWWDNIDQWLIPARMTTVLVAVLLAALVYRWASDAFGITGGLFSLALLSFDPNFLAHSRLGSLDIGVTLLITASLYIFQRTLMSPSIRGWLFTGLLLGLALAAKVSAVILLPVMGIAILWWGLKYWHFKVLLGYGVICFGCAFMVLWAVHLFDIGACEGIGFTVPFPTYVRSVVRIGDTIVSTGRRAYLMGQLYEGGRWAYFPIVFMLKTPLATLILLVITLYGLWKARSKPRTSRSDLQTWLLAGLCVTYSIISINSQINTGYRHLVTLLPFLYIFMARICKNRQRWVPWLVCTLLVWQVISTAGAWPWYLTYFNALAGGPQKGYRYLADSNVDWGQGLKAVDSYLEERELTDAYLSHFTYFIQPETLYDIQAQPLPPAQQAPPVFPKRYNPEPGTYIISASSLRGLQGVDPEGYNWFVHREPDDMIANAMLVYDVPEPAKQPAWLAQCSSPVVPLTAEQISEGFGVPGLRTVIFDCNQSWVYPGGGMEPGWYVIHAEVLEPGSTFMQTSMASAELSFEQKLYRESPALSVFTWPDETASPVALVRSEGILGASALWSPTQAAEQDTTQTTPVSFDGPLSFVGYTLAIQDDRTELDTFWQVTGVPRTLFSVMAHFVAPDGYTIDVGDGLGVPVDQMQVGDIITQRHIFAPSEQCESDTCWFKVGGYYLDNMERWSIATEDTGTDALFIPID